MCRPHRRNNYEEYLTKLSFFQQQKLFQLFRIYYLKANCPNYSFSAPLTYSVLHVLKMSNFHSINYKNTLN